MAIYCEPLFERHAEMLLYGVKIYRRQVVAQYPYRNVTRCEVDQLERMKKDGWEATGWLPRVFDPGGLTETQARSFPEVVGTHHSPMVPPHVFARYRDLAESHVQLNVVEWVEKLIPHFLRKIREGRESPEDIWAIAGICSGVQRAISRPSKTDRDYNEAASDDTFLALKKFMGGS